MKLLPVNHNSSRTNWPGNMGELVRQFSVMPNLDLDPWYLGKEMQRNLPELIQMIQMGNDLSRYGRVQIEGWVPFQEKPLPIYSFQFGPEDPTTPILAFFGGVHGLERIGSRIIIEFLKTFQELLYWDTLIHQLLKKTRIVFYPLVNPGGMYLRQRSNPNGVDLMRNAPVEAAGLSPRFIMAGHRLSSRLPWYRGPEGAPMEIEAQMVCDFVQRQIFSARFAITLDVHSGFGNKDRLWFPYGFSEQLFENYVEVYALKRKLDQALPNHVYHIEPQSHAYRMHGDLWDYLYQQSLKQQENPIFLPLSLELGSWNWIKKNPRQLFYSMGIFNPIKPHRTRRILRRHILLMDFLMRATHSYKRWANPPVAKRLSYQKKAENIWNSSHGKD